MKFKLNESVYWVDYTKQIFSIKKGRVYEITASNKRENKYSVEDPSTTHECIKYASEEELFKLEEVLSELNKWVAK